MTTGDLVTQLTEASPRLSDHKASLVPDEAPQVDRFIEEVARHAISLFVAGNDEATSDLRRIMQVVEARFVAGDKDEVEVITDSFIPSLPWRSGDEGFGVHEFLGLETRAEFDDMQRQALG